MTEYEKLSNKQRRLAIKEKELFKLKAELVQSTMKTIFSEIGINANPALNMLNHYSNKVMVRVDGDGVYTIQCKFKFDGGVINTDLIIKDIENNEAIRELKRLIEENKERMI